MAIFFPFAAPYLNMGPLTKATIAVIQLALWVEKVRNSWVFNFLRNVGTWIKGYHTLSACFWGYVKNGAFCEEMTPGEVFSQPFNQLFGPTPSIFEGFKFPLSTNHLLLIGLLYLALKDKLRLAWISPRTPAPETRDPAPEPDMAPESRVPTPEPDPAPEPDTAPDTRDPTPEPEPATAPDTRDPAPQTDTAQQSTSEMDYPNWVGVLAKGMQEMCQEMGQVCQGICQEMGQVRQEICQEMGQVRQEICQLLREYTSSASEKPSPCPKEGESDGAAVEPTDVTTVQASAEPQGQPQPAAVAPVQRRKCKTNQYDQLMMMGNQGPQNQQESQSQKSSLSPCRTTVSVLFETTLCEGGVSLIPPGCFGFGTLWAQVCNWIVVRQGIWDR
ncbi:coiled-coil domain-containing protein 86-like isoform X1 [Corvus cornix cornix]|uniref:coiled-coil domain-containing protein 86-like isoform X1 n=1 Tax=Corvus cornix cornix TaxID=932674 RepID=UPI00194EDDEC|nr:coiled-coil domain-containing protein 86-like isoform X1 [Corvus cornix cornix]